MVLALAVLFLCRMRTFKKWFLIGLAISVSIDWCGAENLPAGSLVMHGASKPAKPEVSALTTTSPEYLLGLSIQNAWPTNGQEVIVQAFDVGALFNRFVPTLPVPDDARAGFSGLWTNGVWKRKIFKDAIGDLSGAKVQFLGVRVYRNETELLFRGIRNAFEDPRYVGFVAQRQPYGSVRLVDAHIFQRGVLLSESLRLEMLRDAGRRALISVSAPMNAHDQAFFADNKALLLFQTRCNYGHYNLVREAYEQLPAELQSDRTVLYDFASTGEETVKDMLEPIEQWRKSYPDDPSPNLLLVNFYLKLFRGPRLVTDGPQKGVNINGRWLSPQEEDDAAAAVERANAWFADPVMEIRLARTLEAEKARPLLQQAIKRVPANPDAFSDLVKADVATKNFVEAAETLHLQEVTFQTDLTATVNASPDFAEFRNSFPYKKWQHDYHGADAKALMDASAK